MTDARPARAAFCRVPPDQIVARAVTCIGDVALEFVLSLAGPLLVVCGDTDTDTDGVEPEALRRLSAAVQCFGDRLFVSAVDVQRVTVESARGHRFIHATSRVDARTRRFAGECVLELGSPDSEHVPTVTGSLTYSLDVTAASVCDPPVPAAGGRWTDRDDRQLGAIGAIVLEPVAVSIDRVARLFGA